MQIQSTPGKFEGESLLTQYAYDLAQDGDGETYSHDDGGASDTIIDGPFELAHLASWTTDEHGKLDGEEVLLAQGSVGCILHERSDGFVSCEWYDDAGKFEEAGAEIEAYYVTEEEPDDDDLEPIDLENLDEFTIGYVECALWSSSLCPSEHCDKSLGDGDHNSTDSNSHHATIDDVDPDTLRQMAEDCMAFQRDNAAILEELDLARAGFHFWLTRNHHGAGFWDGDYDEHVGAVLTQKSHEYGSVDIMLCDDGKIR